MKRIRLVLPLAMATGIALLLGGCSASYQARSVEVKESLLVNPAMLVKGADDQMLYRYEHPTVNIKNYTKIIIDPVIVSKAAALDAGNMENYQKLANNAFILLSEELKSDYQIVNTVGPETMRVQMAIIEADPSQPVRNFTSTLLPMGWGLNLIKYTATGKQMGVGEITVEMKLTDANTGELLGAAIDRRVGGKAAQGIWDTWYNADQALKFYAQRLRYVLCTKRGGSACVKP